MLFTIYKKIPEILVGLVIESIINHTNMEQIPGLLLFVDFEKAFDSIEWSFIEKTLRHFNFGTPLVSWVKLFLYEHK